MCVCRMCRGDLGSWAKFFLCLRNPSERGALDWGNPKYCFAAVFFTEPFGTFCLLLEKRGVILNIETRRVSDFHFGQWRDFCVFMGYMNNNTITFDKIRFREVGYCSESRMNYILILWMNSLYCWHIFCSLSQLWFFQGKGVKSRFYHNEVFN